MCFLVMLFSIKFESFLKIANLLIFAFSSEFIDPTTSNVWLEGDLLKRPRLANTLLNIEQNGMSDFYNGTLATEIVREVGAAHGNLGGNDLSAYS